MSAPRRSLATELRLAVLRLVHRREASVRGVRIPLDTPVIESRVRDAILLGRYEGGEARRLVKILRKDDRVVEIGGGVGLLSALALKTGLPRRVTVFEAHPDLPDLIRRTHAMNGVEAEVIHAAVVRRAPADGHVRFHVRRNFWASSLSSKGVRADRKVRVPAVAFEKMLARRRPTLLLMDIEGGEAALLRRAKLPASLTRAMIELHPKVLSLDDLAQVFQFFALRGFRHDPRMSHGQVVVFRRIRRRAAAEAAAGAGAAAGAPEAAAAPRPLPRAAAPDDRPEPEPA